MVWLVLWAHQLAAHGATARNERDVVLGLTWMDSGKLYVIPFALLLAAVAAAWRLLPARTPRGEAGFWLTVAALGGLIVGTAAEFWPFPWGSYAEGSESTGPGAAIHAVSSFVLSLGLALFAAELVRRRLLPWWSAIVVVVGGPATIFLSPAYPVPGVSWLFFGAFLARRRAQSPTA